MSSLTPRANTIQIYARLGGALFLLSIVAGGFGEFWAPSHVVVSGDAAATAHNVTASSAFFRAGFSAYLVESACDVALAAILFLLLRPVNAAIALFAAFFHLMATATFAFAELLYFAPALILGGDGYLKSFSADQLNSLALLSLNLYSTGGSLYLIHYGLASMLFGFLMFRSGYLPRLLGVLMALGGTGFLITNFTLILIPGFPYFFFQVPMIFALLVIGVWLSARGIDASSWEVRLQTAAA